MTGDAALDGHAAEHVFAAAPRANGRARPLNRMLYLDTKLWLPDDLLARGDKMSMAASIEARVPLLDHKLVEFAAAAAAAPEGERVRAKVSAEESRQCSGFPRKSSIAGSRDSPSRYRCGSAARHAPGFATCCPPQQSGAEASSTRSPCKP